MKTSFVAFLRAVNVGGTGKLPMNELKQICESIGFQNVKTYIASGNVVFQTDLTESQVKSKLEERLEQYAGKRVGVFVRSAAEMAKIVEANPFPDAPSNNTVAIFLDQSPPKNAIQTATGLDGEQCALGRREIYVYYVNGQGTSKLKILAAKEGTARNLNTVAKLAEMAEGLR